MGETWHAEFLDSCCAAADAVVSEGVFTPGPAIWVGKREVAHFDSDGALDLRLTKEVIRHGRDELSADPRVALKRAGSDWIEVQFDPNDLWVRGLVLDTIDANRNTAPPGEPPTGADLERRQRFH